MDHGPVMVSSLLVLGGARSGKSGYAQDLAELSRLEPVFIATAQAYDDEMTGRIALHAAARGRQWRLVEAPLDLSDAITLETSPSRILLVDCVTLWLTNIMLRGDDMDAAIRRLTGVIKALSGPAILVSNEVGSGIVPDNALARQFRDAQGRVNQALASVCDGVVLVTAGLPAQLKPAPRPAFHF